MEVKFTHLLTYPALVQTLLMWPWWVRIPIEDFHDVTLACEDTVRILMTMHDDQDDYDDHEDYDDLEDYDDHEDIE